MLLQLLGSPARAEALDALCEGALLEEGAGWRNEHGFPSLLAALASAAADSSAKEV